MTVRHGDISGDCRGCKRPDYLKLSVRPRRERIVSRNENAVGFELQIESRFREFGERDPAAHRERAAGQIASEALQVQRVVGKGEAYIKILQRGERDRKSVV